MKDWREYSEKMATANQQTTGFAKETQELTAKLEAQSKLVKDSETALEKIVTDLQAKQESSTKLREQQTQSQAQLELNETRIGDLDGRKEQLASQLARTEKSSTELTNLIETSAKELEDAELKYRDASTALEELESQHQEADQKLLELRSSSESRRTQYSSLMAVIGEIGRLVSGGESHITSLSAICLLYTSPSPRDRG